MPKILFVQSHAMNGRNVEARELAFAEQLVKIGHDVKLVGMSRDVSEPIEWVSGGGVRIAFFAVDDPAAGSAAHSSSTLLSSMQAEPADAVMFKGLGYQIVADSVKVVGDRTLKGAIIGGKLVSDEYPILDFVFIEHDDQAKEIQTVSGRSDLWIRRLPKLVRWTEIEKASSAEKTFDLCAVGQLIPRKNVEALVPLFDQYAIAIVGDGPERAALEKRAAGSRVAFLGQVARARVPAVMQASRILVHPSKWEGLPRAAIEGFACGLPLIGLNSTLGTVFGGLEFAILLKDADEFPAAVADLLGNEDRYRHLSKAARDYAIAQHGPSTIESAATDFSGWLSASLGSRSAS